MDVNRKVSEEDIEEYLVKKAIKKANKLTSRSSSSFSSFYSNQSNPFGDSNLDEKFVWRKKIERDIAQGLTFFSLKTERRRQRERMEDIEKVKKRREQRAFEKRQHEEERELLARERARAEFQDWQKKEDCAIPQFVANDDERKNQIQEPVEPEPPTLLEKFNLNKAMGAMKEGDGVIGSVAEVNLDSQVEWWCDKYQPRKPKYVNTFHTGYEWNKYNRTHYDHENPPPKIVRGYKFNIFYPDMINRTETPTYTCEDDSETCIIRFHAGPPYEDIAFRIVKKDWDVSHKKGFKSTFDGVILRLHFNFRRHSYRRADSKNGGKTIKLYDTNLFLVRWQKIYEFNQTQHPSLRKGRGGEKKARRNNQEGTLDPLLDLFACSFKNHHVCANKQAWQHSAS
ncbi:hypothetical protein POPTR_001G242900v4 [Populus trichocarpa]|uniref:Splicing factor Cactin C-terminal domain-containing protein n=1 Tax=Populus trichocarpa TaxID=3694 RepID=A0A3N7EBT8_POPTR|nr:hypothetical protein POPTR_001G242900v4 [Populus trichocarpa]